MLQNWTGGHVGVGMGGQGPTKLFAAYEQIISPLSCLQNSSMILYSMILSYDRSRMVKEEFQSNYALSKAGGNNVTENSF